MRGLVEEEVIHVLRNQKTKDLIFLKYVHEFGKILTYIVSRKVTYSNFLLENISMVSV